MKSVIVNSILSALLIVSFASEAKVNKIQHAEEVAPNEGADSPLNGIDIDIVSHNKNDIKMGKRLIDKVNEYGSQEFFYREKEFQFKKDGWTAYQASDLIYLCKNSDGTDKDQYCKLVRMDQGMGGYAAHATVFDPTISSMIVNEDHDETVWQTAESANIEAGSN